MIETCIRKMIAEYNRRDVTFKREIDAISTELRHPCIATCHCCEGYDDFVYNHFECKEVTIRALFVVDEV